jgi:hypothetical protein
MVQADDETANYEPQPLQTEALLDPIRIAVQAFVGNVDNTSKQMSEAAERFAQDYAQLIHVAGEARRKAAAEKAARLQEETDAFEPELQPVMAEQPEPEVVEEEQGEPMYYDAETMVAQSPEPVFAEEPQHISEEEEQHQPELEPVYAQAPEPVLARAQDQAVEDLQRSAVAVTQAATMAADAARDAAAGAAAFSLSPAQLAANEATDRRLQRLEEDISVLTGLMRDLFDRIGSAPVSIQAVAQQDQKKDMNAKISRRFRMREARKARQDLQAEQRRSA